MQANKKKAKPNKSSEIKEICIKNNQSIISKTIQKSKHSEQVSFPYND
jgi:hypothetical protein